MPPAYRCARYACNISTVARIVAAFAFAFVLWPTSSHAQNVLPEPAAPVTAAPQANPVQTEPPAVPLVTAPPSGAVPAPSATPSTGRRLAALRVTAHRIAFYSNRFIVGADDDVQVRLGDGTRISGNTFFMDLRLNRFVIAGNVKVFAAGREIDGAAFSEYFDFDRAYFVPIIAKPDRWTFVAGDYAHPARGREMPGDTFFLPDLSGERVFLYAGRATIDPKESVRFAPAKLNFGLTFATFPSYFLDFSQNPNYAQNALPGAYVDGPLDYAGGEHGLATAHVRYDALNGFYPAYEQHFISNNSYVVAAASPLTRPFKIYNLLAYDRISPNLQAQFFAQESAFGHGFSQPLAAGGVAELQLTAALAHSYLQLMAVQTYESLLGEPPIGEFGVRYYGDQTHDWVGDHPFSAQLSWVGFKHKINDLPLFFQLRSSIGYAHNGDLALPTLYSTGPLQTLGGVPYTTVYSKGAGIDLTTASIPIVKDKRHRDFYLTGTFDKQRLYYSAPHHTDTTSESISLTKLVDPQKLTVFASYTNTNIGDFYGSQQRDAYISGAGLSPVTGLTYPSYAAFQGFATTRSFAEQLVYTPNQRFNLNVTLRENRDFPEPIPGYAQIVGDGQFFANYGMTPYQATVEMRYRINRLLVLDVARSYYFNFGGYERWQPQFSVQVEK